MFGEIKAFRRIGVMDPGQGFNWSAIQVESGALDELACLRIIQDGQRIIRMIGVVVINNDFTGDARIAEGGSEVMLDELSLV